MDICVRVFSLCYPVLRVEAFRRADSLSDEYCRLYTGLRDRKKEAKAQRRVVEPFFLFGVEWNRVHYFWGHYWPIVPAPGWWWWWWWLVWSNWWSDWQVKLKHSEKTYPSAALSTTNPTWLHPCSNTSRRSGKPASNRLSYGTEL
jgi:hypothetical protein